MPLRATREQKEVKEKVKAIFLVFRSILDNNGHSVEDSGASGQAVSEVQG